MGGLWGSEVFLFHPSLPGGKELAPRVSRVALLLQTAAELGEYAHLRITLDHPRVRPHQHPWPLVLLPEQEVRDWQGEDEDAVGHFFATWGQLTLAT